MTEADRIIEALGLAPHPEGGHYRETFRDVAGGDGRARSTAILFLLKADERSHWHRVDAVEIWHWHAGAPLALSIATCSGRVIDREVAPDGRQATTTLGGNILAGETPQGVVPEGAWQSARSLGAWTLVGCTVAPGFEFAGFELAPPGWSPDLKAG